MSGELTTPGGSPLFSSPAPKFPDSNFWSPREREKEQLSSPEGLGAPWEGLLFPLPAYVSSGPRNSLSTLRFPQAKVAIEASPASSTFI